MTSSVELAEFFSGYAASFTHGDLDAACALFAKAFCLSGQGGMMMVSGVARVREVLAESLSRYSALGIARAKISKLNPHLYASDHALADLEWTLLDAAGEVLTRFDATYVLRKFGGVWRIVLVIAHNEEERLRALAA